MLFLIFTDVTKTVVCGYSGAMQDLTAFPYQEEAADDDPRYLLYLKQPVIQAARQARDVLLREVYDVGVSMVMRGLRMTTDPDQIIYLNGKLAELDSYSIELLSVPEQEGFPDAIEWPSRPAE